MVPDMKLFAPAKSDMPGALAINIFEKPSSSRFGSTYAEDEHA